MAVERESNYRQLALPNPEATPQMLLPSSEIQTSSERQKRKKIGLLIRISSGRSTGDLYDDIRSIEAGFKAGGLREIAYFYNTSKGRQMVLASPEELREVIAQRTAARKKG